MRHPALRTGTGVTMRYFRRTAFYDSAFCIARPTGNILLRVFRMHFMPPPCAHLLLTGAHSCVHLATWLRRCRAVITAVI